MTVFLSFTRFPKPVPFQASNSTFRSFSNTRSEKGGAVAWALRLSSGQEYRMTRWTNIFPTVTTNDAFLAEEPAAVHEALEQWLAMKDDWERNNKTREYEHNMTSFYAPFDNTLCPNEYGFIVTDFMTKQIVACTSYCSFFDEYLKENHLLPEAEMGMLSSWEEKSSFPEYTRAKVEERVKNYQRVKGFFDEGRLHTYLNHARTMVVDPLSFTSFQAFVKEVVRQEKDLSKRAYVGLLSVNYEPPSGWKFEEFYHSDIKERQDAL